MRSAPSAALLFTAPTAASAAEWLKWDPAPECPDAAYIEGRVAEWLAGGLPPKGQLAVGTTLTWDGTVWVVEVEVSLSGQSGKRRVAVTDCNDAADFVAVTVVLAVDPSLTGSFELPAGATQEGPDGQPQESEASRPPGESATAAPALTASAAPTGTSSPGPRPHLSAGVEGAAGILPEPTFGLNLAGGFDLGRVSLTLGGRWLVPRSTLPVGSAAPIDFSLWSARLVAGYSFFGPRLQFGPTLAVEGGAILASQGGAAPRATAVPWVGVGVGGQGMLELSPRFSLFLQAELSVPLTQATFALSSGQEFHQAALGGRAELGGRFFWTDR